MTCREHQDLMMAYLDNELNDSQKQIFEDHIAQCQACADELKEFQRLKQMTDDLSLAEPEDHMWKQYWDNVYNRVERGIGWILFSVAGVLLILYGGAWSIRHIITDPTVSLCVKIALLALVAGLAVLFVSIFRERLYFWNKDRYRNVRR